MASEEPTKKPSLNRIMAEINKKAAKDGSDGPVIGRLKDMDNINVQRIPSGVPHLDEVLGGGWPTGRIIELYGLPSAGKSLIAQRAIGEAQKLGLECVYVDCEGSFDPEFATVLGVKPDSVALVQTSIGEDVIDVICKILESEPGIIVVDSVASMITRAEMEAEMDQQFMAIKARMLSRGIAKINALNKKTLILFINQVRAIVTTWGGGGNTTPGGQALKFYASIRLEVKKTEDLRVDGKKTTDIIGQVIGFEAKKNKTASPFKKASFKFWYEDGRIEE